MIAGLLLTTFGGYIAKEGWDSISNKTNTTQQQAPLPQPTVPPLANQSIINSPGSVQAGRDVIIAAPDQLLQSLRDHNKSLREKLWEKYPFGYVLFGGEGGDIVSLPFYRGDLQVQAEWEKTEIQLDRQEKIARVKIPQPHWKAEPKSGGQLHVEVSQNAYWEGHYSVGQPVQISLVRAAGQPIMYFEVIDENQRTPVYAIGFRKEN